MTYIYALSCIFYQNQHKFVRMNIYLNNLLPRVKQYSQDLDKKELFLDIPWVIIDEQNNQQKYIFKRNGELVMSLNGQVTMGKWEYLSSAKSLLIDRIVDKILLNQNFIDSAVMVLKKDGTKDENLILANEIILPDLDIVRYLKNLFYRNNSIALGLMKSGENLEFYNYQGIIDGNKVAIDGKPVPNGVYEFAKSGDKIVIDNSNIIRVLIKQAYDTNNGVIIIEQTKNSTLAKGDFVFTDDNTYAPDGKYKIGFFKYITVENGQIIK